MQVKTQTRKPRQPMPKGAMAKIVDEKREPLTKSEPQDQPVSVDDRMQGNNLANEAIAVTRSEMKQRATWPEFGRRLRHLTAEGRKMFLSAVDQWLREFRKQEREAGAPVNAEGKPEPTKAQGKLAGVVVSSATTELSKLRTIADAWNNQATDGGLLAFYAGMRDAKTVPSADEVPHRYVYAYAASLRQAAAGRKMERFGIVMQKLLESRKPREDAGDTDADAAVHAKMVALVAELVKGYPAEVQPAKKDALTREELMGL